MKKKGQGFKSVHPLMVGKKGRMNKAREEKPRKRKKKKEKTYGPRSGY